MVGHSNLKKKNVLLQAAKAAETQRAIFQQWRLYQNWCKQQKAVALPSQTETLEAYLIYLVDKKLKPASINQSIWAINSYHYQHGFQKPAQCLAIQNLLSGIRRTLSVRPQQKSAFTIEHIQNISFKDNLIGWRNKALLLLGFAGGFRRSELAMLNVENIHYHEYGCQVDLEKSKTNQMGNKEAVQLVFGQDTAYCPVLALQQWVEKAGLKAGALFCSVRKGDYLCGRISGHSIGLIVKQAAVACEMDPKDFGGHSLRAGCATYLLEHGVPLHIVAKQLRHKKIDTTLRYDRNQVIHSLKNIY